MTLLHENSIYNSLILFKHNILRILINLKKKKKRTREYTSMPS